MHCVALLLLAVTCNGAQYIATYPGLPTHPAGLIAYPYPYPGLLTAAPITLKTISTPAHFIGTIDTTKTEEAPGHLATSPSLAAPFPLTYTAAALTQASPISPISPIGPVSPVQSRFHAQDELGQYSFGYTGGLSSRAETRDVFGRVSGAFNYIDADGQVQSQRYVADSQGFRTAGTDIPVAPDTPIADPVKDTVEVAKAKARFRSAYEAASKPAEPTNEAVNEAVKPAESAEPAETVVPTEAVSTRRKRAVLPTSLLPYNAPFHGYNYRYPLLSPQPLAYTSLLSPQPLAYTGLPAVTAYTGVPTTAAFRDATLLKIANNPGHAESYRVD